MTPRLLALAALAAGVAIALPPPAAADGYWIHEQRDSLVYGTGVKDEWQELLAVAEVPADVGKLVILLGMGGQPAAADVVWLDDVTCLRLP